MTICRSSGLADALGHQDVTKRRWLARSDHDIAPEARRVKTMRPSLLLPDHPVAPFAAIAPSGAPLSRCSQADRSQWHRAYRGCTALLLVAAALGCTSVAQEPEVTQAWVQAASDGQWVARALTDAASCPSLRWRGGSLAMSTRSQPAVIAARMGGAQADVKPAEFAQHSCEVAEAAALRAQPAPGAVVQSFATHPGFGFASLDRRPTG